MKGPYQKPDIEDADLIKETQVYVYMYKMFVCSVFVFTRCSLYHNYSRQRYVLNAKCETPAHASHCTNNCFDLCVFMFMLLLDSLVCLTVCIVCVCVKNISFLSQSITGKETVITIPGSSICSSSESFVMIRGCVSCFVCTD